MAGLIIVSNRLPVSVKKVDGELEYSPSIGGLSTALASYAENGNNKWIGWPGIPTDELTDEDIQRITKKLRKQNCYPVFLTQKQLEGFYNGYSNSVLWPMFHHLPIETGDTPANWKAYKEVNRLYADVTLELSKTSDDIWVHDYQLLLLPEMLRVKRPKQQIGFFLHIPFPVPKDLFQTPHAADLLRGVLGSDLIGTHTTAYANNFLDCVQQAALGVVGPRKVALPTRIVRVKDFPIGINYDKFAAATKAVEVKKEYTKLLWKYRGRKVILTIDRLDPTKGLVERLKAYHTLLKENPTLHGKVVMVMQAMPSRTEIDVYKKLRQDVDTLIDDINKTYGKRGWEPVEPIFSALPFATYAAMYQRADVAFIAPIRDGMNLVAKEYLASRPRGDGVLVLSETAGAAEELKDAVLVNPAKPRTMVQGLQDALTMKPEVLKRRTKKMQRYLKSHTVDKWANNFITSLAAPVVQPVKHFTRSLIGTPEKALVADYHQAKKRLILLDYDGTLQPIVRHPEDAKPSRKILNALERLGSDKRNEVVIISGRDKPTLEAWLGHLPVTLVAEHGAFLRKAGWKNWRRMLGGQTDWKKDVTKLFNYYAAQTPGATVEQKEDAVVWHYRGASPFHAQKNLVSLKKLLKPIARTEKLRIKDGKKALEVHHLDIGKGHALREWLLTDHDFLMIAGDDVTDEDMFTAAPKGSWTIKVGRLRSAANYRLPTPDAVHKLLRKL